jgi:hypothetical protein
MIMTQLKENIREKELQAGFERVGLTSWEGTCHCIGKTDD